MLPTMVKNFIVTTMKKIAMFGETHAIAVDGYSRKIVRFITIPVKNAIAISDLLLQPILLQERLWDQIRFVWTMEQICF